MHLSFRSALLAGALLTASAPRTASADILEHAGCLANCAVSAIAYGARNGVEAGGVYLVGCGHGCLLRAYVF